MFILEIERFRTIPKRIEEIILNFYNLHFGKSGILDHETPSDREEELYLYKRNPLETSRNSCYYKVKHGRIQRSRIIDLSANYEGSPQEGPVNVDKLLKELEEINKLARISRIRLPKRYR